MKNKGITLIVLVITIIILLILAGITIVQLTGNGLFGKAKVAEKRIRYVNAKEIVNMKLMETQLECTENNEEYNIIKIAEGMKQAEEITIERYYNKETASIKEGVTENLTNLEGIAVSVNEYSEYKFLIGEECQITRVLEGKMTEGTTMQDFTAVEEFENQTFGNIVEEKDNIEFTYERSAFTDKMKLLIKIKGLNNGLSKVEFPEGDILDCKGKNEVGIDYTIQYGVEYKFKVISNDGYEKEIIIYEEKSKANSPKLSSFNKDTTFYVTYDENGNENSTIPISQTEPENWYDYENGKWANIKTVQNGLEAYWVWIPRYEYLVPKSTIATEIEVMFIPTDTKEGSSGYKIQSDGTIKSSEGYTIHPTFTNLGNGGFGELDGIWVSKFEASSNTDTPDTNYGGGNDPNLKVQVKPGVQSWRNIITKNIFNVCRKMTNEGEVLEGATVDSHLMKNIEWGAVVLLSQSKYGIFNPKSSTGINGDKTYQIWRNVNGYAEENTLGKYIYTGFVGSSVNNTNSNALWSTEAPMDVYEYNSIQGTKASTTGTLYGIYDMSGGSWDFVAACPKGYESMAFGVSGVEASRWVDLYDPKLGFDTKDYSKSKIGEANREILGWGRDYNFTFPHKTKVIVASLPIRGGLYGDGALAWRGI